MADICTEMNKSKQKVKIHMDSWLDVFMTKSKQENSKLVFGDIVLRILLEDKKRQKKDLLLFDMSQSRTLKSLSAIIHQNVLDNLNEFITELQQNQQNLKNLKQIKGNCLRNYFIDGYQYLRQQMEVLLQQKKNLGNKIEKISSYFHIRQKEQTNYIFEKIHEFSVALQSRLDLIEGSDPNCLQKGNSLKYQNKNMPKDQARNKQLENSIFYNNEKENKENLFEVSNQQGIFRNRMKSKRILKTQYFLTNTDDYKKL